MVDKDNMRKKVSFEFEITEDSDVFVKDETVANNLYHAIKDSLVSSYTTFYKNVNLSKIKVE